MNPVKTAVGGMVVAGLMAIGAVADTHYVWTNSPTPTAPYTNWTRAAHTIQPAIGAAQSNDTVLVTNGLYSSGGVVFTGAMTNRVALTNAVRVQSVNGPDVTIIRGAAAAGGSNGNSAVRCAYVGHGARLIGFTLTNGHTRATGDADDAQSGGGAWCESDGVISNCTLSGNSGYYYGGAVKGGTLYASTLSGNVAQFGGGAHSATLKGCTLTGNASTCDGGGAHSATLVDCTLTGNTATNSGGGALGSALTNCTLTGNAAMYGGGASWCTLNHCTLNANSASNSYGGGANSSTLIDCALTGNAADYGGGADSSALMGCTLTSNRASSTGGGTFYSDLTNCTLSGNTAPEAGGAVGGTLARCTLVGNTADYGGGAGDGTLITCTLIGNTAAQFGGGARNATLIRCILTGNSANDGGAADTCAMVNCLLTNNAATHSGGGTFYSGLTNCTLTGNTGGEMAGGAVGGTLVNCIVYGNTAPSASNYASATLAFCCAAPLAAGTGNKSGNPRFVDPAGDRHLMYGSPCIETGTNLTARGVTNDLDGLTRPIDGNLDAVPAFDIGCYEYDPQMMNSDGDAMTDWQELVAGTNPTNAASYFQITAVGRSAATCTVQFASSVGRLYTLECRANLLSGAWTNVPNQTHVAGTGSTRWLCDTNLAPPGCQYRVQVEVP
jgi:parallel beta-helix repeat protein